MTAPFQSSAAERLRADIAFCRRERFPRAELRLDDAAALLAEHDSLTEEVARLREALQVFATLAETTDEKRALAAFAREVIRDAWNGGGDGGSVQAAAEHHGLIVTAIYEPEKHGDGVDAEVGDEIFVLADWLK